MWAYAMFVCVVIWSCNTILYYNTTMPKIRVTETRGVEYLNLLFGIFDPTCMHESEESLFSSFAISYRYGWAMGHICRKYLKVNV